jgi:hypothetical protein
MFLRWGPEVMVDPVNDSTALEVQETATRYGLHLQMYLSVTKQNKLRGS